MHQSSESRVLLINITGHDKTGVTHSLTRVLAEFNARILDIGQAVIHDALTLGILVELSDEMRSCPVMTELLLRAHEVGVQIRFTAISAEEYQQWVENQSKRRFLIAILGPNISGEHLAAVSGIVADAGLNIDRIDRLSGRTPLQGPSLPSRVCVEFAASGEPIDEDAMRAALAHLTEDHDIDIAFQHDTIYRKNRRLVCFDMDSTLIQTEVIDELAKLAGVGEQVQKITESAMRGELDFQGSFRKRVVALERLARIGSRNSDGSRAFDGRSRAPDLHPQATGIQDRYPFRRLHVRRERTSAAARNRLSLRERTSHPRRITSLAKSSRKLSMARRKPNTCDHRRPGEAQPGASDRGGRRRQRSSNAQYRRPRYRLPGKAARSKERQTGPLHAGPRWHPLPSRTA